jgi:hypothetical protein
MSANTVNTHGPRLKVPRASVQVDQEPPVPLYVSLCDEIVAACHRQPEVSEGLVVPPAVCHSSCLIQGHTMRLHLQSLRQTLACYHMKQSSAVPAGYPGGPEGTAGPGCLGCCGQRLVEPCGTLAKAV